MDLNLVQPVKCSVTIRAEIDILNQGKGYSNYDLNSRCKRIYLPRHRLFDIVSDIRLFSVVLPDGEQTPATHYASVIKVMLQLIHVLYCICNCNILTNSVDICDLLCRTFAEFEYI